MSDDFAFSSPQQRELYLNYQREFQRLDWESIHGAIRVQGQYLLGLARDLMPSGPQRPAALTEAERERQTAWSLGLFQVALREQQLSVLFRPDPETGQNAVWVAARDVPPRPGHRQGVPAPERSD
jgi:hypothetical protein